MADAKPSNVARLGRLAGPIFLSILLQMAGGFIEIAIASSRGPVVLGVIAVAVMIEALPVALISGIVYAVVPRIGALLAEGQTDKIAAVMLRGFVIVTALTIITTVLMAFFSTPILRYAQAPPELLPGVEIYLRFVPAFILGNVLFILGRHFLETCNQPLFISAAVAGALIARTVFLLIFVRGEAHTVESLALIFALSGLVYHAVLIGLVLVVLLRHGAIRRYVTGPVRKSDLALKHIWPLFLAGLPVGLHYLSDVLIIAVVGLSVAKLGVLAVGAHALAFNMLSMALIPAGAVAMASSILAAKEVALKPPRQLLSLVGTCVAFGIVIACLPVAGLLLWPEKIFALYEIDPSLIPVLRRLMPLAAMLVLLTTTTAILGFILRGIDDGGWVLVSGLIASWLIMLPVGGWLVRVAQGGDDAAIVIWWWAMLLSAAGLLLMLSGRLFWRLRRAV